MASPAGKLQPKHYKALELWEEGLLSIKEIANAVGIPLATLYDLFEGNAQKAGNIAHLFLSELEKITVRSSSKVRKLVKDNKKLALWQVNDRLKELKDLKDPTPADRKELISILNALNKATPGVEIGSFHSLSVTRGMTPEELVYEFQRLKAIANNTFNPRGVRETESGTEGRVPGSPGTRGPVPEE
jgi:hypothetical protein